jgi:FkbM family methyltransferase
MATTATIEEANRIALEAPRVSSETPWAKIWAIAKDKPYRGLVDISIGDDVKFCVLCMNDDAIALQFFWTGGQLSEPRSFNAWKALAKEARFVIDAGAYTGFYGIIAATLSKANVVAYEPVSFIFARLAANVMLNELTRVKFENMALADREGTLDLAIRFGPRLFSSGSKLGSAVELENAAMRQPCATTTLDKRHGDDPVDLIKIDVEGAEEIVLRGAVRMLSSAKPVLLLETRSATHRNVLNILEPLGYKLQLVEESGGALNYLCWHPDSRLSRVASEVAKKCASDH